mgnify:FL=1
MHGLERVNLLVGTNNCGKTSVLEAIRFLGASGAPQVLIEMLDRRGEFVLREGRRQTNDEYDPTNLIYGREEGVTAKISSDTGTSETFATLSIEEERQASASRPLPFPGDDPDFVPSGLVFKIQWSGEEPTAIPLSRNGGVSLRPLLRPRRDRNSEGATVMVTTDSLGRDAVVELLESVALTEEQDRVVEALRQIEPRILGIASTSVERRRLSETGRGGVIVKLGKDRPVPIGNLGDGMWRILALALALVQAANGVLLIDEIDTGLHHTVMDKMWKLVAATARRLNVQVFATTHSRDCYEGLAAIAQDSTGPAEISIQRIERGREGAIAYDSAEIRTAAARGIEVR